MSHQKTILPVVLETAVAITILAVGIAESAQLSRRNLNGFDLNNQVFCLHTIGSDVLHSTGSDIARNQRQVLGTIESLLNSQCHYPVPLHTTAAGHPATIDIDAHQCGVNHNALEVASQQQVAASTYYYIRLFCLP